MSIRLRPALPPIERRIKNLQAVRGLIATHTPPYKFGLSSKEYKKYQAERQKYAKARGFLDRELRETRKIRDAVKAGEHATTEWVDIPEGYENEEDYDDGL